MNDAWFRWEREATIHLLYPTLEGSMKPLEEFSSFGFPTTILIFKNGIVTWCVKNKEKGIVEEVAKRLRVLESIEQEIKNANLGVLTNEQISNLYKKLHDAFINL